MAKQSEVNSLITAIKDKKQALKNAQIDFCKKLDDYIFSDGLDKDERRFFNDFNSLAKTIGIRFRGISIEKAANRVDISSNEIRRYIEKLNKSFDYPITISRNGTIKIDCFSELQNLIIQERKDLLHLQGI